MASNKIRVNSMLPDFLDNMTDKEIKDTNDFGIPDLSKPGHKSFQFGFNAQPDEVSDSVMRVLIENSTLTEAQAMALINKILGKDIITKGNNLAKLMAATKMDQGILTNCVNGLRTSLTVQLMMPNLQAFHDLINAMPVIEDIEQFATEKSLSPKLKHGALFHSSLFTLQVKPFLDECEGIILDMHTASIIAILLDSDDVVYELSNTKNIPRINPMVFIKAGSRKRIVLKILDDMFGACGNYGNTLELGDKGVYDTSSFEAALADRMRYVTSKWTTLCKEDRISWIMDEFTHSSDALENEYDKVKIAGPNIYIG